MIKEIAFTAYPAKDVAGLRKWYEDKLGLKFTRPVRRGRRREIQRGQRRRRLSSACSPTEWADRDPGSASGVVFEVDDIDKTVADLRGKGINVEDPYATPVCKIASFDDLEGNKVSLHQVTVPPLSYDGRARADVVEHLSARETEGEAARRLEADRRALRAVLAPASDGAGLHRRRRRRSASCPAS